MTNASPYPRYEPSEGISLRQLAQEFAAAYATEDGTGQAIHAHQDRAVKGIVLDHRATRYGDIFAALTGANRHGSQFATRAVAAGAQAVWTDPRGVELLQAEQPAIFDQVPVVFSADPRALIGPIAAAIMGHPSEALRLVGITGSNGKTTTAFLVAAALAAHYGEIAVRGTIGARIGAQEINSERTTAEAPELQEFFALMRQRHIPAGVLEVSSHAIALNRVAGTKFSAVAFTNLQRDHLDFHGNMENYFQAKLALLHRAYAHSAVVCVDDEWGERAAATAEIPVVSLSTVGAAADWRVTDIVPRRTPEGTIDVGATFNLSGPDGTFAVTTSLAGAFNVTNVALAILLAHQIGVPIPSAIQAIGQTSGVPGRMERVFGRAPGPLALVDYAHAPDSVVAAAQAARPLTPGRLIIAVGAGGDRDEGKRFDMGKAAANGADVVVITDDNPRFEDPAAIRAAVRAGAQSVPGVTVLESKSRGDAVAMCADLATEADTILFAGKGHETSQDVRGEKHHFDDREELRNALDRRWQ